VSSRSFKGKQSRAKSSPKRVDLAARKQPKGRLPSVEYAVWSRPLEDLGELYAFWGGDEAGKLPKDEDELRNHVLEWMCDGPLVARRLELLDEELVAIVEHLLNAPRYQCEYGELSRARVLSSLDAGDLEQCLTTLQRRALVVEQEGRTRQGRRFALPEEVGDGVILQRRRRDRRIFDVLTLRGYLDRLYSAKVRSGRTSPHRVREMYKMYAMESAAVARIDRLPDGIRNLVEKAILEFGGILPRQLFLRMKTDLPHWNGRRWRMILEKSLVGTVERLELSSYGIRHADETLVVFNEVALAWLRRVAVPGDPDRPHEELSLGIDLVSNLTHFLAFILEHDVRFTVRGEIFKTTERKILQHLIPNPGRELSREEVLGFIYAFCRHLGLIDSTGKRTIALTAAGREWSQQGLADKLQSLLDFALEEREEDADGFHQTRIRKIFMRMLKRIEPGVWYDLMYLPFLARNNYLSSLDDMGVREHFAERIKTGRYSPTDDPQRLAWNLVRWLRKRLYLLGLIDLGYDRSQRPVAMRLTRTGARLLGLIEGEDDGGQRLGNLVVTPDFEVVLFPTGDDAELVHDLDRFCDRDKQGHILHYRVTEESVRRALTEGLYLERILGTLDSNSRTPVPQNVRFSIRDWAHRAGLMTLDAKLNLRCEDAETWRRFSQDPGARPYVGRIDADGEARLKGRISPKRMQALLQELGYLIELV